MAGSRIAVFTSFFPPAVLGGGPIRTLAALVNTAPSDVEALVVTRDTDLGQASPMDVEPNVWIDHSGARVRYVSRSVGALWKAMRSVREMKPDAIYVNSYFDSRYSIVPQILTRARFFGDAVLVVAPRGEFGSSALGHRSRKKSMYLRFYRAIGQQRHALFHASSAREQADIQHALGAAVRTLIREDATELPAEVDVPAQREQGPLRAVFVGRLVPIKGLDLLLESLARVAHTLTLDVYGPAEDIDFAARCQDLAESLPAHVVVRFRGSLAYDVVRATIAEYDVMLFPTRGENFGHVVPEALSVACPVMCADTTLWTNWLDDGGGLVVRADTIDGWAHTVDEWAGLTSQELLERRELAAGAYGQWRSSAATREHLFTTLLA